MKTKFIETGNFEDKHELNFQVKEMRRAQKKAIYPRQPIFLLTLI